MANPLDLPPAAAGADAELRPGEIAVKVERGFDGGVHFIGRIETPWRTRAECPHRGDLSGPVCRIEVFAPWSQALAGIESNTHLQVLYWMHRARRDLVKQNPGRSGAIVGTVALRSPVRPNPIASALVALERVEGTSLYVRGLDCLDGTPLVDLKPEKCPRGE
jgi:tRNA-Thr(GGU) m(6)t(6)A37 methyltransferase TsaA